MQRVLLVQGAKPGEQLGQENVVVRENTPCFEAAKISCKAAANTGVLRRKRYSCLENSVVKGILFMDFPPGHKGVCKGIFYHLFSPLGKQFGFKVRVWPELRSFLGA